MDRINRRGLPGGSIAGRFVNGSLTEGAGWTSPGQRVAGPRRRLAEAFSSPDSYGLVLLLILVTYALSAGITAAWAVSLVLLV